MFFFFFLSVFFFQAEDGIRDLVRSRGLGDVYKRQERDRALERLVSTGKRASRLANQLLALARAESAGTVSYTHLTLPTSDLV